MLVTSQTRQGARGTQFPGILQLPNLGAPTLIPKLPPWLHLLVEVTFSESGRISHPTLASLSYKLLGFHISFHFLFKLA